MKTFTKIALAIVLIPLVGWAVWIALGFPVNGLWVALTTTIITMSIMIMAHIHSGLSVKLFGCKDVLGVGITNLEYPGKASYIILAMFHFGAQSLSVGILLMRWEGFSDKFSDYYGFYLYFLSLFCGTGIILINLFVGFCFWLIKREVENHLKTKK